MLYFWVSTAPLPSVLLQVSLDSGQWTIFTTGPNVDSKYLWSVQSWGWQLYHTVSPEGSRRALKRGQKECKNQRSGYWDEVSSGHARITALMQPQWLQLPAFLDLCVCASTRGIQSAWQSACRRHTHYLSGHSELMASRGESQFSLGEWPHICGHIDIEEALIKLSGLLK